MSAHCKVPAASRLAPAALAGAWIAIGIAAWSAPAQAQEACPVDLVRPPAEVRIDYDPFVPARAPDRMSFQVRNPSDEPCLVEIALMDVGRQEAAHIGVAPTGLEVEFRPTSAELSRGLRPGVFHYLAPPGASEPAFDVVVTRDAVVEAGAWPYPLTLALRPPGASGAVAFAEAPVGLVLNALPRAQLNLSGSSGAFGEGQSVSVVDFGVAETGATRRLFIQTRTNAPARLSFTSLNAGRLKLPTPDKEEERVIDYTALLAGVPLDLTRPSTRDVDPPRTLAGQALELILTLGDVRGAQAGTYSDELTIEISTL